MGDVIDLGARRATATMEGSARCLACKHDWIAVAPAGTASLECPSCGLSTGRFVHLAVRNDRYHWLCACGNDLFHLTPEGSYCPVCGDWVAQGRRG